VNPPHYYYTHEEIDDTLRANGISPRACAEQCMAQMGRISPIPVPSVPAPLFFDLANLPQNNAIEMATAGMSFVLHWIKQVVCILSILCLLVLTFHSSHLVLCRMEQVGKKN
jgi:hypothetical protein